MNQQAAIDYKLPTTDMPVNGLASADVSMDCIRQPEPTLIPNPRKPRVDIELMLQRRLLKQVGE